MFAVFQGAIIDAVENAEPKPKVKKATLDEDQQYLSGDEPADPAEDLFCPVQKW